LLVIVVIVFLYVEDVPYAESKCGNFGILIFPLPLKFILQKRNYKEKIIHLNIRNVTQQLNYIFFKTKNVLTTTMTSKFFILARSRNAV